MSTDESSSYAPKSPDLSSLFSAAPTDHHQPPAPPPFSLSQNFAQPHHHPPPTSSGSYYQQPQSYSVYSTYVPPAAPAAPAGPAASAAHPHYSAPAPAPAENIAYIPAHHHPQHPHQQHPHHPQLPPSSHPNQQFVPPPSYGQQHQPRSFEPAPLYAPPPTSHPEQLLNNHYPSVTNALHDPSRTAAVPIGVPSQQTLHLNTQMPPRRSAAAAALVEEPVIEPSPVRTKFPTARIKRIMQADEEVGKVAQQTPIAVGKALELFMVQLVSTSADIAKDKGSKRVTASMLKQVVERDDQWDFLREIVGKVEAEKEGSKPKQPKGESESDEDAFEPKKRGRGGRKKKSVA